MSKPCFIIASDSEQANDLFKHQILVVSPMLSGQLHELEILNGKPVNVGKGALSKALHRADFRNANYEPDKKWIVRGTLAGPGIGMNALELLAPSFFVSHVRHPDGHWLDFKETIHLADRCALDVDVSYVRIESALLNKKRLQMIANEACLPNGIPAYGILVRPEDEPSLQVRFLRETPEQKGNDDGEK